MRRLDALAAIYPKIENLVVVTIMGAVAAELQSIGHRANFFYLQHAMGLASSMGLGIALSRPERRNHRRQRSHRFAHAQKFYFNQVGIAVEHFPLPETSVGRGPVSLQRGIPSLSSSPATA